MEQFVIVISFITASALTLTSNIKEYRTDYEYCAKTDAFYKLHIEETNQMAAQQLCVMEGATLMLPTSHQDIVQAHAMFKKFPDLEDYMWIASDGNDHQSAEEPRIINLQLPESQEYEMVSSCDILTREGEIETTNCYKAHPFICKVEAKDAPYDDQCGVYGTRYVYYESVDSCYKVPLIALTWNEAYAECRAEGSHLLTINSLVEQQAVWDVARAAQIVSGGWSDSLDFFFFVGIRATQVTDNSPIVWRTIFNETLREAGYDVWAAGCPNNDLESADCGTMSRRTGKYKDLSCRFRSQFICEKEVQTIAWLG